MYPINLNTGLSQNILASMYNVDPDIKYRQLNRQIYNETAQTFYHKNCDKSITSQEIANYLKTYPERLGIVVILEEDDDEYEISKIQFRHFYPRIFGAGQYNIEINDVYTKLMYENNYFYMGNENDIDSIKMSRLIENILNLVTPRRFTYDLLTYYNIYKNRTNCMNVNKNYAKNKILKIFYEKTALDQSFLTISYVYHYLILNCFVFNLLEKSYEPLPPIALIPNGNIKDLMSEGELVGYMLDAMENPIDEKLQRKQKVNMVTEIMTLSKRLENHIINL